MSLYKRLGDLESREDIDAFAAELIDRFGKLPDEVRNLLQIIEIKALCRTANIEKIEAGAKGALITFHGQEFPRPEKLIAFAERNAGVVKLRPDHRLFVKRGLAQPAAASCRHAQGGPNDGKARRTACRRDLTPPSMRRGLWPGNRPFPSAAGAPVSTDRPPRRATAPPRFRSHRFQHA